MKKLKNDHGRVALWPLLQHVLQQRVTTATRPIPVLDSISDTSDNSLWAMGDSGTLGEPVMHVANTFFPRLKLPDLFLGRNISLVRPGEGLGLTREND